jgi:hypothetical protein
MDLTYNDLSVGDNTVGHYDDDTHESDLVRCATTVQSLYYDQSCLEMTEETLGPLRECLETTEEAQSPSEECPEVTEEAQSNLEDMSAALPTRKTKAMEQASPEQTSKKNKCSLPSFASIKVQLTERCLKEIELSAKIAKDHPLLPTTSEQDSLLEGMWKLLTEKKGK